MGNPNDCFLLTESGKQIDTESDLPLTLEGCVPIVFVGGGAPSKKIQVRIPQTRYQRIFPDYPNDDDELLELLMMDDA